MATGTIHASAACAALAIPAMLIRGRRLDYIVEVAAKASIAKINQYYERF